MTGVDAVVDAVALLAGGMPVPALPPVGAEAAGAVRTTRGGAVAGSASDAAVGVAELPGTGRAGGAGRVLRVTCLVDQAAAEPPGQHPDAGRDGQEGAGTLAREAARLLEQAARVALVEPGRGVTGPARHVVDEADSHAVLVGRAGHRAELVGELAKAARHAGLLRGGLVGEVAPGLSPELPYLVLRLAGDLLGFLARGLRDVPRRLLGLVPYGPRSVRGSLRSGRLGLHEYPVLSSGRRRSTACEGSTRCFWRRNLLRRTERRHVWRMTYDQVVDSSSATFDNPLHRSRSTAEAAAAVPQRQRMTASRAG